VIDFLSQGALEANLLGPHVVTVRPIPPKGWAGGASAWYLGQVRDALALVVPEAPAAPEVPIRREAIEGARRDLASRGIAGRFAAIHPGSGSPRKNWPLERFAEVAARLRGQSAPETTPSPLMGEGRGEGERARNPRLHPPRPPLSHKGRAEKRLPPAVLWIVGPAELERGRHPAAPPGDAVLVEPPLETLAAVLATAHLYIGNDSGITHLAAAVRGPGGRPTPTVAIFGPTDPAVWAPRGPHVRIVRAPGGKIGGVSTARVWRAVRRTVTDA
jgi:ADP-heptose:LPS heptosyltransferase